MKPLLLDLFCGAGGAAMGYHRAGFEVIGVDIEPQPNYPFPFIQGDAMTLVTGTTADVIHASPPCQRYSSATANPENHPDLIHPLRLALERIGVPFVIENVPGAPLHSPVTLCGSMFGLRVRRHRLFETNWWLTGGQCDHVGQGRSIGVYGKSGGRPSPHGHKAHAAEAREIMEMPWATYKEVAQAIPPAYTEHIGRQLMEVVR